MSGVKMTEDENENPKTDTPSTTARDPAYFSYYAQFVHQQNMLQDTVRTSTYQSAILANGPLMFTNKIVLDVGAGSGILSYFSAQAGAKKVYAVEASSMAQKIRRMINATRSKNTWLAGKIEVVQAKIEDTLPIPKVDTIVSEPIGVLLVHERMLESFLYARDHYLNEGGSLMPSAGTIYLAPFSDANLWTQTMAKVRFWEQSNFYGVDFSPLSQDAKEEIFGQPVVGNFDHRILLAPSCSHIVDFQTIKMGELQRFFIPISWTFPFTGIIHGIAGWFDINLGGFILSTAPTADRTHWQQVRFLLKEPLAINAYETVKGWMRLMVNDMRSYDVVAELIRDTDGAQLSDPWEDVKTPSSSTPDPRMTSPGRRRGAWQLQEQTYYYENYTTETVRPEYNGMYAPDTMDSSSVEVFDDADIDLE
ncbi:hypothetical protein HK102_008313 [Quaeritorhiza haematococci]|nr:hypothetical protein HK102_008313 [Quaeritorhiza haematococci]